MHLYHRCKAGSY